MSYEDERDRPGRQPVSLLRLYVPFCQLRYGTTNAAGTCPAVLGVDSETKCHNTLATCPVPNSFDPADVITTFCTATQDIPPSAQIQPTITRIDAAPRRLAPTKGLGEGAQARITLINRPWHDVWEDPYRDERTYNPIDQGSYWPKWLARNPYYRGIRAQLLTGYIGEDGFDLADFENREYILDNIKGTDRNNRVTLELTDVFRLLEKDRSLYPAPNTGELAAGIDTAATSFTLAPTGIGDAEYPASFRCIIGDEGMDVTRSGDTCTVVQRGLYKGLDDHEAEDTVQIVGQLGPAQVNQIAETIITTVQPDLASWIPTSEWQAEADQYLPRLYSSDIVKPTGVNELLKQIMDSAPVMFWPNPKLQRIEMRAIKAPTPGVVTLTDRDHYYNLEKKDRPKDRLDAALVYFSLIDDTGERDEKSNYLQGVFSPSETNYKSLQVRVVFAPFISQNNKAAAIELAELYRRRYKDTPATLKFELDAKHSDVWTGSVFLSNSDKEQDETGANKPRHYLVTEAHEAEPGHRIEYEAESYDWWIDESGETDAATVIISANSYNLNLRDVYDTLYANVRDNIEFIIESGVVIGSSSTAAYALESGDWPEAPSITIKNNGIITGKPGDGGQGGNFDCSTNATGNGFPGEDGGPGMNVTFSLAVDNTNGIISGGPGGGGGGAAIQYPFTAGGYVGATGGGGGAGRGYLTGQGAPPGSITPASCSSGSSSGGYGEDGSVDAPGNGGPGGHIVDRDAGDGGNGGDWAQNGQDGQSTSDANGGPGGSANIAINGVANITWTNMGTIYGATQ